MNVDQLVDRLTSQFDAAQSLIVDVVNERQREMVVQAKWLVSEAQLGTTVAGTGTYAVPGSVVHIRLVQVGSTTYSWASEDELLQFAADGSSVGAWFSAAFSSTGAPLIRLYPAPDVSGLAIMAVETGMPVDAAYGSSTALAVPADLHMYLRAGCRATLLREISNRPDLAGPEEQAFQQGIGLLRKRRVTLVSSGVTYARVQGQDFLPSRSGMGGGGASPSPTTPAITTTQAVLPFVTPEMFGAIANGTDDDAAAITAAIGALPASGGLVFFAAKTYAVDSMLDLDGLAGIQLVGANAKLVFRVTGATTGLSMRSATRCRLQGLTLVHTDPAWTGKLVDMGSAAADPDTSMNTVRECYLAMPQNAGSAAVGVALPNSYGTRLEHLLITGGAVAIDGVTSVSDFVNATLIDDVNFQYQNLVPIRNLGAGEAGNTIRNCTVEPLLSGHAGFYAQDPAIPVNGLTVEDNWFGDAALAGDWITVNGHGVAVNHNRVFHGARFVVANAASDIEMVGNRLSNMTNAIDVTAGTVRLTYLANIPNSVTTSIVGTPGAHSVVQTVSGNGTLSVYGESIYADRGGATHVRIANTGGSTPTILFGAAEDTSLARHASRVFQTTAGVQGFTKAGAISDADFAATPPDGSWGINTTASTIMVRIGGSWKSTGALS